MPVNGVVHQRSQSASARHIGKPGQFRPGLRGVLRHGRFRRSDATGRPQQVQRLGECLVVGDRTLEDLPQPVGGGPGLLQCIEHGQGVHTLAQVGAGQFAGLVGAAGNIDDVVGDLENRPDDRADPGQSLDLIGVGTGERPTELPGGGDQAGGLLRDHLQVVRDGIVGVTGTLGLAHLTGDQQGECLGDDAHRVGTKLGYQSGRRREQIITGQDRNVVAPAGICRRNAAAHLGLVHNVIVIQRGQVHQFDNRTRNGDLPGIRIRPDLRRQNGEQRSEPLTARLEQMQYGLGHQLVTATQFGGDHLLDPADSVADRFGEHRVAEIHARHHGRRCPHPANIL